MEAYCRFHDLPIPKVRLAELKRNTDEEICKVKAQLQLEINKINSHLKHFHNQFSPYKDVGEK